MPALLAPSTTCLLAIAIGALAVLSGQTQPEERDYIHAEVQGLFSKATNAGDEHAGFQIAARGVTWEVDLSADPTLLQRAGALAGKAAVATGSFVQHRDGARLRSVLVATTLTAAPEGAAGEHIDVTVRGTLTAGVMAIGGETTGVTITAGRVTWDLALKPDQRDRAGDLNGRKVVVSGRLRPAAGVEIKDRFILHVRALDPAKP